MEQGWNPVYKSYTGNVRWPQHPTSDTWPFVVSAVVAGPGFDSNIQKRVCCIILDQGQNLESLVMTTESQAIRLCRWFWLSLVPSVTIDVF